jgi:histidinol-phosphate aminotransferase
VIARLGSHPTWRPYPSRANFFLVRTPDAESAWRSLLARGILVRRQDHLPGLAGCLRISVGTPMENDAFLKAAFESAPD